MADEPGVGGREPGIGASLPEQRRDHQPDSERGHPGQHQPVTGTLNWVSGTVTGPLTIASGGLLNISGSVILENVLTNAGTVTMTGAANMTVYNNNSTYFGGVYNLAGALWDIQTNANIYCVLLRQ